MNDGSNQTPLVGVKELLRTRVVLTSNRTRIFEATVGFQAHFLHHLWSIILIHTLHIFDQQKFFFKELLLLLSSHCTKKAAQYWGGYCSILLVLHSVTLTLASARRPSKACHGLEASTGTKAVKKGCCWLAYCAAAGFLSSQQPTCFLLSAERAFLFSTIEARQQGEKHGASL